MNYTELALSSILETDQSFYDELLEQMDIERDFMIACIHNNIILEADEANTNDKKKGNWLKTIIEFVKSTFNKFAKNMRDMYDEDFLTNKIDEIPTLNLNGIVVNNTVPYRQDQVSAISKALANFLEPLKVNSNSPDIEKYQTIEALYKHPKFSQYVKTDKFADDLKRIFKVGEGAEDKPSVKLEGNQLVTAVKIMVDFCKDYNKGVSKVIQTASNNFSSELNAIERKLNNNTNVSEAFCLLEEAYFSDTELKYCVNYKSVFEDTSDANTSDTPKNNSSTNNTNNPTNNNNTQKEVKKNDVQDTSSNNNSGSNSNKSPNSAYDTYIKNVSALNRIAITAAMTAVEQRYVDYMRILRNIYSKRGKKTKPEKSTEENK